MEFLLCNTGKLAHCSPLFLLLSLVLYTTVPSAISSATVQVDEVGDIVTWQPPPQPNGVIQNYNIRISRVVQGVTERSYDFSTLELSAGTYMIQVSSQLCFAVYIIIVGTMGEVRLRIPCYSSCSLGWKLK